MLKWFVGLFASNGAIPKPNDTQEDWETEYHKIKDTGIMKSISVCLMQNGEYNIVNEGRPIASLMIINTKWENGSPECNFGTASKNICCKKCVKYYRGRVKHVRENTVIQKI